MKIDFFGDNLEDAIESGIYKIVMSYKDIEVPLYIGESIWVITRCGMHLYRFRKKFAYFGFTSQMLNDKNITIKFSLIEKVTNMSKRKHREKKLINKMQPILQTGIRDCAKKDAEKIESVKRFMKEVDNKTKTN